MAENSTTWKPGKSANPGGRSKMEKDVRDLAREHSKDAIEMLAQMMKDVSVSSRTRVAAAEALLDRAWGRPPQAIVGGDEESAPIRIEKIERVIVDPTNSGS